MQMNNIYEDIKIKLCNNDHKLLEGITAQFISCKSIEIQKKILVLLLRNVKKDVLQKYKVLDEYNEFLMRINSKQMKEGIYDLLYKMHNVDNTNDNDLLNKNIQVCIWNYMKFEDKEIKVHNGYVFIDVENVVFYSPIENFVIDHKSIISVNIKDNNVTFKLKTDRKFIFSLIGDRKAFVERLKSKFNLFETKENAVDIYRTPNTSAIIKNEDLSLIANPKEKSIKTSFKRSSLSKNKLEFHSGNLKKFGKNLTIKINAPKKEIFHEKFKENVDEEKSLCTSKKSFIKENDDIKTAVYDIKVQSSEESNSSNMTRLQDEEQLNIIENSKQNEFVPNLGQLIELNDTTVKKISKNQIKSNNNAKQEKIKSNKRYNKKLLVKHKIKTTKKMKKFVKALTKKRMKNLNSLHKLQANNIKQKGKAFELIIFTFIKKYMRSIKQY